MKRNRRKYQKSLLPRLVVVVFAALYMLFSVGVLKATHYCMGREASIAYFTAEAHQCACSIFAKDDDFCCDDRQDLLKIDDSQKSLSTYQLSSPALTLLGALYHISSSEGTGAPVSTLFALRPQPPPKVLYKVFCSFVFYEEGSIV
jgi:hypothetical protein